MYVSPSSGGNIKVDGTIYSSTYNHQYPVNTYVPIEAMPASGYQFSNWSGSESGTTNPLTIKMTCAKTVTANFSQATRTLTMQVNGSGSTTPAVGPHVYNEGTTVPITAIPSSGWQFVNWTGSVANPSSASTTVTVSSDKTVTANFSQIVHTLTMQVNGGGSTDPAVGTHDYNEGTVVSITATPNSGWQFVNWTGSVANPSSTTTTVTMDSDKTLTANFSQAVRTLTMQVTGSGSSTPAVGTHNYDAGTVVSITATPGSGWQFVSWTGGVADSNSATTTVPMDSDKTVIANFSNEDNPALSTGFTSILDKLVMAYGYKEGEGVGGWTAYNPGWATTHPEWNTLALLHQARGYWIQVTQACSLVYGANTYELDEGWNLLGWLGL